MTSKNLKQLLTEKARLQANKSDIEATAYNAIKDQIALINSDLEAVNGFISEIVETGAAQQRAAQAKDTGAVNFVKDGIKVTHTVAKTVNWDQDELSAVVARIAGAGDDPNAYVKSSYKVSERAYKQWPDAVKRVFNQARTVKPGKPKIIFKEV